MNTSTLLAASPPGMISIGPLLLFVILILLLLWTVRTKKYLQTLFGLLALVGGICCIVGFNKLDLQTDGYIGTILIGIGLLVVLGVTIAAKILYFRSNNDSVK